MSQPKMKESQKSVRNLSPLRQEYTKTNPVGLLTNAANSKKNLSPKK